jgi:fatty-acid desaturase
MIKQLCINAICDDILIKVLRRGMTSNRINQNIKKHPRVAIFVMMIIEAIGIYVAWEYLSETFFFLILLLVVVIGIFSLELLGHRQNPPHS